MSSCITHVEHWFPIEVHDVNDDFFNEPDILRTEGDCKPCWFSLDPLTGIAVAADLLKLLLRFWCGVFRSHFPKEVVSFFRRGMEELSVQFC